MLPRREVLAPEDGKVTNIRAFTPGASIAAGEPILDLVPAHDRFVAEAQVQPTDIEQVAVGHRVNVRLAAYRMRSLPMVQGRAIQVAADAQTPPGKNAPYYLVRAGRPRRAGAAVSPGTSAAPSCAAATTSNRAGCAAPPARRPPRASRR